jgi:hypothetical protein
MSDSGKTQAPFTGQSAQQVKSFLEHPYIKAVGWLFTKGAWFVVLWAIWSLKQYGHTYVAESPAVEENRKGLSALVASSAASTAEITKVAERQANQLAQMQSNQIEINRQLEKTNHTIQQTSAVIAGLQTAQAVLDVRVNNLERRSRDKQD